MLGYVLFWLAVVTAVVFVATLAELVGAARKIRALRDVPPLADAEMPSVSVVVAARNEARGIEHALRSLLALDVPRLEVIVVDDRSDDATGAIVDRAAAGDPRLAAIHVTALPAGWLGKNHALWLGAARATGELILFTDADVVLAPDTLRRAAGYLRANRVDHLAAGMHVDMPGWLLQTFGVVFGILFSLFARPWKASDPRSKAHVGIGAFNLIRAEAYRRIGTHRVIAMRPDDDLKLGKLVKKHGLRQDFVDATDHVRVEWYHSVPEAIRGLRKNGFAGTDYRLSLVLLATVTQPLMFIWPFLAVWVTHGATRLLNLLAVAIILALFAGAARAQRGALVVRRGHAAGHRPLPGSRMERDAVRADPPRHRVARHALFAGRAQGEPGVKRAAIRPRPVSSRGPASARLWCTLDSAGPRDLLAEWARPAAAAARNHGRGS